MKLFFTAILAFSLLALPTLDAGRAVGETLSTPRFVSLRSDKVNLRAGPGKQYPVEWVFVRRGLPVEIVKEYGDWRRIRDIDGSEGWVHRSLLSSKRWALVSGATRTLRHAPGENTGPLLRAEAGVLAKLRSCGGDWCRLEIAGRKGWLRRGHIWGAYPNETFE